MPSATPLPRGPSVLVLGCAAELLTGPGCPVCPNVAETSERYLAWFALEAHADAAMLTRLSASLGMCPPHTRRLISQPGAAGRLTAVYRYVIQAAIGHLTARGGRPDGCPACQHDAAATERGLDILLDGLEAAGFRERYQELGGLCVPHLRAAAGRGRRADVSWLAGVTLAGLRARPPRVCLLAGGPDQDADARARLRVALPPPGPGPGSGPCPACRAAALAERAQLGRAAAAGSGGASPHPGQCLCAAHLRDAALTGGSDVPALLAWQAGCQAASLAPLLTASRRRHRGSPAWPRASRRHSPAGAGCPVCRGRDDGARQELERCRAALRAWGPPAAGQFQLCVRHALSLQAGDASAGEAAAPGVADRANTLLDELAEAFRKDTWGHRHEARGAEMTAWRRAAAFLDGAVCGGCPVGQPGDSRPLAGYRREQTPAGGGHDI